MDLHPIFQNYKLSKFGMEINIDQYPLLSPEYLIVGVLFYILSVIIFSPSKSKNAQNSSKKSDKVRTFGKFEKLIFIHNSLLAIFSAISFINSAPIVFNWFAEKGFVDGVCEFPSLYDSNVSSFGYWSYLFYVSKFYEFIDTWIIIARGRKPSFLQEYHHVGIIIGMWIINVSKSFGGAITTIENSFIHSIMYSYYAVSIIGYGHKFPLKKSTITRMQLIQFLIGCSITGYALLTLSDCLSIGEKLCGVYFLIYTGYLVYLFAQFYINAYLNKNKEE